MFKVTYFVVLFEVHHEKKMFNFFLQFMNNENIYLKKIEIQSLDLSQFKVRFGIFCFSKPVFSHLSILARTHKLMKSEDDFF